MREKLVMNPVWQHLLLFVYMNRCAGEYLIACWQELMIILPQALRSKHEMARAYDGTSNDITQVLNISWPPITSTHELALNWMEPMCIATSLV